MTQSLNNPARPGPRLSGTKRTEIITLLAKRETQPFIAAKVGCSQDNVKYYAANYRHEITELQSQLDVEFATTSFSSREKRMRTLNDLAERLEKELETTLLTKDKKIASNGTILEFDILNEPTIRQLRGTLDDLAKENGERKEPPVNLNIVGHIKGFMVVSPDDWDLPAGAGQIIDGSTTRES